MIVGIVGLPKNTIGLSQKTPVEQHPYILEHDYNECSHISTDGENKSWFALVKDGEQRHFPHMDNGVSTIRYFISETSLYNSSLTWNYDMPNNSLGEEVKQNFLNSILKWNNIYFYANSLGPVITKKKLVNIIEGSSANHNVLIHPEKEAYMSKPGSYAEAGANGSPSFQVTQQSIQHLHYDNWNIALNLESTGINTTSNYYYLNRIGAHEFGHVLGLRDIDDVEGYAYHHNELLMGYSTLPILMRQSEITYKDLVGAAITRGYHTDSDHQWIYDPDSSYVGSYKLICSICNGIKYVNSLNGINYVYYKVCLDEHDLSDGNMFAVASYKKRDYYKCKYCKYVAPFEDRVQQNYSTTQYNTLYHLATNQVTGLNYSFYQSHLYNDSYIWFSYTQHRAICECGSGHMSAHAISSESLNPGSQYAYCLLCGGLASIGITPLSTNELPNTPNGSYILPNGVVVLAEDDYEAYFNDALVFNYPNSY